MGKAARFALTFAAGIVLAAPARAQKPPEACPAIEEFSGEPATPEEFRARVDAARRNYQAFACQARQDRADQAARRARVLAREGAGKLGDFVGDETLRRGDVVVTDKGLRVYRGAAEVPAEGDFRSVEEAVRHPGRRKFLLELERASGLRRGRE